MDSFTANVVTPGEMQMPQPQNPKKSFRVVFMLLLLAVLASAVATAFILISGQKPQIAANPSPVPTKEENPFVTEPAQTNPFSETAEVESVAANPFSDDTSDNPFDQFDTLATSSSDTETYQNPF